MCGIGVVSAIDFTFNPKAPRARTAGIQRIPLPPPPAPETYEEYVRRLDHVPFLNS